MISYHQFPTFNPEDLKLKAGSGTSVCEGQRWSKGYVDLAPDVVAPHIVRLGRESVAEADELMIATVFDPSTGGAGVLVRNVNSPKSGGYLIGSKSVLTEGALAHSINDETQRIYDKPLTIGRLATPDITSSLTTSREHLLVALDRANYLRLTDLDSANCTTLYTSNLSTPESDPHSQHATTFRPPYLFDQEMTTHYAERGIEWQNIFPVSQD